MRIYLDACCVNRPTDQQSQPRIREESAAIERILAQVHLGTFVWLSSEALIDEIERSPDLERRRVNITLLAMAADVIEADVQVLSRARKLESYGYGAFDSLHIACAEAGHADILFTTDDKFLRRSDRGEGELQISVRNPVSWLKELSL